MKKHTHTKWVSIRIKISYVRHFRNDVCEVLARGTEQTIRVSVRRYIELRSHMCAHPAGGRVGKLHFHRARGIRKQCPIRDGESRLSYGFH